MKLVQKNSTLQYPPSPAFDVPQAAALRSASQNFNSTMDLALLESPLFAKTKG
jgi:hypothetical protein